MLCVLLDPLTCALQVIKLLSVQVPEDTAAFTDMYLLFERMDCDLTSVIKSSTAISEVHAQVSLFPRMGGKVLAGRHDQ